MCRVYYLLFDSYQIILLFLVNVSPRWFSLFLFGFGWRLNAREYLMSIIVGVSDGFGNTNYMAYVD